MQGCDGTNVATDVQMRFGSARLPRISKRIATYFWRNCREANEEAPVHVHLVTGDDFYGDHSLLFGLVRQQLAANDIADRIDIRKIRLELGIDFNLAALTELQAERLGVDSGQNRLAPDRDEHVVSVETLLLAILLDLEHDRSTAQEHFLRPDQ